MRVSKKRPTKKTVKVKRKKPEMEHPFDAEGKRPERKGSPISLPEYGKRPTLYIPPSDAIPNKGAYLKVSVWPNGGCAMYLYLITKPPGKVLGEEVEVVFYSFRDISIARAISQTLKISTIWSLSAVHDFSRNKVVMEGGGNESKKKSRTK